MPIKIPDRLPAKQTLIAEGVAVMSEADAVRQDIRPLKIGLLNLMPDKISTETQLARLLGATPLQIELTLVRLSDHISRNTSANHMAAFYRPWTEVSAERFDGFIITGAPVERLEFEDVSYWDELKAILDWTQTHVHRCFAICWAAQAALFHFQGITKAELPQKAFGVFQHRNLAPTSPYLRGFSDQFPMPVSRWSATCNQSLKATDNLQILAESEQSGIGLLADPDHHMIHMFNHLEYDTVTLAGEYQRDGSGALPTNYFPNNDPASQPENSWRAHAHLLFGNWIDEIYQSVPFDREGIGKR